MSKVVLYHTKGRLSLYFIDMRTTVSLSISCGKNVFLLENFNKTTFFLYEMDKLTVVLISIKWLNKKRWPLVWQHFCRTLLHILQVHPFCSKPKSIPIFFFSVSAISWVSIVKNGKILFFRVSFVCQKWSKSFQFFVHWRISV